MPDFDEKSLAMVLVAIMAVFSMYLLPDAKEIVLPAITGISGLAIGRGMK